MLLRYLTYSARYLKPNDNVHEADKLRVISPEKQESIHSHPGSSIPKVNSPESIPLVRV